MNVSVRWYKNNMLNLSLDYNDSYANASLFIATLDSANTTKTEIWSCGLRLFDGTAYSDWINSSAPANVTILNSLPTVTLTSPPDNNITTNRTPTFTWSGSDDDNDAMSYQINISLVAASACSDPDDFQNLTTEIYTPSVDFSCISDNNDYYVWTVRANDSSGYGAWAVARKINISAVIDISLPTDYIDFGFKNVSYTPVYQDNTTDDSPAPFVIQNDGNALVNITINASDLWTSVSGASDYYKFKVDNVSGEEGAFDWAHSNTSWAQMPNASWEPSPNVILPVIISELNYSADKDSAEIDIHIQVPPNEWPGLRKSTIYFTSSLAE